ncbi:hypothetical protein MAR_025395 [Mya arenaria]|uniref:Uncharacterized protein n=1 Tax=Mya arenaria TaxID=6604 RepID=A0ABY7DTJ9_MYAAR|nr:hypothetical protein MAR_025395 [Mya arenaria]
MREYRARKKEKLGEKEWLKKERARTKAYFKLMALLDESKQRRKQEQKNTDVDHSNTESQPSTSTESNENEISSTKDTTITIKLPFPSRAQKGKKRTSRALSKAYRRVETLEDQNEALKRKLRSAQRQLQRYEEKKKQSNTPRGKTDSLLKQSGINPQTVPEIRKRLIFSECLNEEIRSAKDAQENRSDRKTVVHKVVSGRVIKRYRLKSTLEEHTRLNRRKSYACKSVLLCKRSRLTTLRQSVRNEVLKFLERDDNSRVMPGKADAAKTESTIRISKSSFYKCRPNYICPVNFASQSVCLCSNHQNFCFLLRTLKALNVTTCGNPDKFVEMYLDSHSSLNELLNKISTNDEKVKFQQWK